MDEEPPVVGGDRKHVDRLRSMAWVGVRRAVLRALPGALAVAALPALVEWEAAEAGGKHKKRHKKCRKKRCKKNRKQCDRACNELPDGDRDICMQDCKIAQKQCKKVC